MQFVTSADGTRIAYRSIGSGPPLIFVAGAFGDHRSGAELASVLAEHFTVFSYDRRGRGASGDQAAYAVTRELEDIAALLPVAGGRPAMLGFSSGAMLVLEGAAQGLAMGPLVLVEPPYLVEESRPRPPKDFPEKLRALIDAGDRGGAVELFQTDFIGIPRPMVEQMRQAPFRPGLEAMAHTTIYDTTIAGDLSLDPRLPAAIAQPALVLAGTASAPFLQQSAKTLAAALPGGRFVAIEGMQHDLGPALAPAILAFLG